MTNTSTPGDRNRRVTPPKRTGAQFQLRPQWWNWVGLRRTIDDRIQKQGADVVGKSELSGMRFFWIDGVFSSISDNILLSFLSIFVLAYGATNGQIGLLNAIGNLFGVLALFPGAAHAERTLRPKRLVLWTGGGAARLMILLMVLVPVFLPGAQTAIWALILLNAVRSFFGNYANPAWTGMVAELVPQSRRARYFSDRNVAMGIAGMAALWLSGLLVPRLDGLFGLPFLGFQTVLLLAFFFGMAGTLAFSRIPKAPRPPVHVPRGGWNHLRRALKHHREFGALLAGTLVWNFSVHAAVPFFNVFLITDLGGSPATVGLTAGVTTIAGLGGFMLFGRMAEKRGTLSVVRLSGLLIPVVPALWAISQSIWQVYALSLLTGFLWAGYNMGSFNLLLEFVPHEEKTRGVALYQLVVFGSAVAGPVVGGVLVDALGFRGVFGFSAIGRLLGTLTFLYLMRVVTGGRKRR